jgi:hypothetical protein
MQNPDVVWRFFALIEGKGLRTELIREVPEKLLLEKSWRSICAHDDSNIVLRLCQLQCAVGSTPTLVRADQVLQFRLLFESQRFNQSAVRQIGIGPSPSKSEQYKYC